MLHDRVDRAALDLVGCMLEARFSSAWRPFHITTDIKSEEKTFKKVVTFLTLHIESPDQEQCLGSSFLLRDFKEEIMNMVWELVFRITEWVARKPNTIKYNKIHIYFSDFLCANLQKSSPLDTYFSSTTLLSPQNTGKFLIIQVIKILYILSLNKLYLWQGQNIANWTLNE